MKFTFEIQVEVERDQGKFASREEICEYLLEALDEANPESIYGVGADGDSEYSVTQFDVEERVR